MLRGGPILTKRRKVRGRGVPFIGRQAVLRVKQIEFPHHRVALHLGEDRGCGNRNRTAITFDDRFLLDTQVQTQRIHQQVVRLQS